MLWPTNDCDSAGEEFTVGVSLSLFYPLQKSVDKKLSRHTKTQKMTLAQHRQKTIKSKDESAGDRSLLESDATSEWDSSIVDTENEYIPPKDECEDSTDDSLESKEIFEHGRNMKRTANKDYSFVIKKPSHSLMENGKQPPCHSNMSYW